MPIPFLEFDFVTIIATVFWIWMLVDCVLTKRFKLGWFVLIFFTHWIGAIIYYFVDCSHKNPLDALSYYVSYIQRLFQQTPAPTPPPQSYSPADYQQGYQAQQQEPFLQSEEAAVYHPQLEYEQPTATYPEMPTQQQ